MNPSNRAILEASKRLMDAGIVLETEAIWRRDGENETWYLAIKPILFPAPWVKTYPAPSMAEVWRELPEETTLYRGRELSEAFIYDKSTQSYLDKNPTDALIDLLIFIQTKG